MNGEDSSASTLEPHPRTSDAPVGDADPPARDTPAPPLEAELVLAFQNGALAGQTFEFQGRRHVVLGRAKDCDIEIFDQRVSRRHCAVVFDGHKAHVKDLVSANGTYVNGELVGLARLETGDMLRLGDTIVRVELGDPDRTIKLERFELAPERETGRHLRDPDLRVEIPGFELTGVVGEGATSAVFEARAADGEVVAIKIHKVSGVIAPEDRERFRREVETASSLEHPNVVKVLGHGEAGERLFIVMEYVRGETVKARLRRLGSLPVPVALHVTRQIASALEHARAKGIVHRDVKPDNILIQEDGVAKLVDFGLAKSMNTLSPVTRAGDVLGTLAYMSPEQLDSSVTADHRSDIYSLGATLYHTIAGATPFAAKTSIEYFQKILREEPPILGLLRRDVPPIVSALVSKCLRKRAADRYQTAAEIESVAARLLASGEQRTTTF